MISLTLAAVVSLGLGVSGDRMTYHFTNPSSWDTPFLVPHFFEQSYRSTAPMLTARIRAQRWELEAGVTAVRNARGSDYDTFFQPSGDVVVHGTTTDVAIRSWRVADFVRSGNWRVGLAFAHDQMKFPTSLSTTTHSSPPSTTTSLSTTLESTASDVLELRGGIVRARDLNDRWRVTAGVDVAPLTFARLTTYLPDKYPGQPIRFSATGASANANVTAEWRARRAVITFGGELGHSWHYKSASSFTRSRAGASILFGLR